VEVKDRMAQVGYSNIA